MDTHTWTVTYLDGETLTVENFYADGWQISVNGDLALVNDPHGRTFFVRAFAKGVWKEIHLVRRQPERMAELGRPTGLRSERTAHGARLRQHDPRRPWYAGEAYRAYHVRRS